MGVFTNICTIKLIVSLPAATGNQAQFPFRQVGRGFQLNGGMVDVLVGQVVFHLSEQGGAFPNGHLITDNCMAGKHI